MNTAPSGRLQPPLILGPLPPSTKPRVEPSWSWPSNQISPGLRPGEKTPWDRRMVSCLESTKGICFYISGKWDCAHKWSDLGKWWVSNRTGGFHLPLEQAMRAAHPPWGANVGSLYSPDTRQLDPKVCLVAWDSIRSIFTRSD